QPPAGQAVVQQGALGAPSAGTGGRAGDVGGERVRGRRGAGQQQLVEGRGPRHPAEGEHLPDPGPVGQLQGGAGQRRVGDHHPGLGGGEQVDQGGGGRVRAARQRRDRKSVV